MSEKLRNKIKKIIKEQITDINPTPVYPIADPDPPGPGPGPGTGGGFDPGEKEIDNPDKTIPINPINTTDMTVWVIDSATPNTGQWVSYDRTSCDRSRGTGTKLPKRRGKIIKNLKSKKRKTVN